MLETVMRFDLLKGVDAHQGWDDLFPA